MVKDCNNFIRIYYMKANKSVNRRIQRKKKTKKLKLTRNIQNAGAGKGLKLDVKITNIEAELKESIKTELPKLTNKLPDYFDKSKSTKEKFEIWKSNAKDELQKPGILAAYDLFQQSDLTEEQKKEIIEYLNANKNGEVISQITTEKKKKGKEKKSSAAAAVNAAVNAVNGAGENAGDNAANISLAGDIEADCGPVIAEQTANMLNQQKQIESLNEKIESLSEGGKQGLQTVQSLNEIMSSLTKIFNMMSNITTLDSSGMAEQARNLRNEGVGMTDRNSYRLNNFEQVGMVDNRQNNGESKGPTGEFEGATGKFEGATGEFEGSSKEGGVKKKKKLSAPRNIKIDYSKFLSKVKEALDKAKACDSLDKSCTPNLIEGDPQFWDAKPAFVEINNLQDSDQKKRLITSLLAASMGNLSYFSSPNLEDINALLENDFSKPDESGLSPQREVAPVKGSKSTPKSIYRNQLLDFETYTKLSEKAKEKLYATEINKFIKNCFKYGLFLRICYFVYMYSLLIKELDIMKGTDGYQLPYSNKYFFKNTIESDSKFNILIIENNDIKMLEVVPPSGSQDVNVKISYGTSAKEIKFPDQIKDNFFYPICMLINYLELLTENNYLAAKEIKDMINEQYQFLVTLNDLRLIRKAIFGAFDKAVKKENLSADMNNQSQNFKTSVFLSELIASEDTNIKNKLNTLAEGLKEVVKSDSDQDQGDKLNTKETYVGLAKDMGQLQALFNEVPELPK